MEQTWRHDVRGSNSLRKERFYFGGCHESVLGKKKFERQGECFGFRGHMHQKEQTWKNFCFEKRDACKQ
jgi:hypothetical protein